jgi:hypothetical protein
MKHGSMAKLSIRRSSSAQECGSAQADGRVARSFIGSFVAISPVRMSPNSFG